MSLAVFRPQVAGKWRGRCRPLRTGDAKISLGLVVGAAVTPDLVCGRSTELMKKMRVFSCLVFWVTLAPHLLAGDLTDQRCKELISQMQPGKDAVWRTIPWKLSVLQARAAALQQDKPIFIWAMDGHPLGCT